MNNFKKKLFRCDNCNKDIRMLVGKEKLSVVCQSCRGQAKVVTKKEEAKKEENKEAAGKSGAVLRRAASRLIFTDPKKESAKMKRRQPSRGSRTGAELANQMRGGMSRAVLDDEAGEESDHFEAEYRHYRNRRSRGDVQIRTTVHQ